MSRPKSIIVVQNDYRILSDRFYEYQKRLGYVNETCRTRQLNVNEFLSWLEQSGRTEITKVKPNEIQAFYKYISERPSKKGEGILSQKTTHHCMKSIEHLFSMLQAAGAISINPISTLKFHYPRIEPKREILTQDEITALYKACETGIERSILSLGYGCGLRVGEIENIDIEDIKLREKIVIIPKGKGNKRRVVPMSSGVVTDLSDYYFNERESLTEGRNYNPKDQAFMLNKLGGRMREWTYNSSLKTIIKRTAIKELKDKQITMHSLRHSIATHLIQQGIPVEQVRQFLGHSQLETTQIYTHISQEQIKDLMK